MPITPNQPEVVSPVSRLTLGITDARGGAEQSSGAMWCCVTSADDIDD